MRITRIILAIALLAAATAFGQSDSGQTAKPEIKVNPEFAKMGTVFYVDDPAHRNWVTFKSSAPLEDIVGTSNTITGYLVFDPDKPTKGGRGELSVPVASLKTGIPLRDSHLLGKAWFDAETYPGIKLTITDVKGVKEVKVSGGFQTYDVTLAGEFTMRGKSKKMEIPGRVTYLKESEETKKKMEGNLLAARATFEITLADFGIVGPEGAGLIGSKVGESVSVEVSIMGTTNAPGMKSKS
jgi:polyisoprenoid-binding protein YceI